MLQARQALLWDKHRDYSFDATPLRFLYDLQDRFTDIFGHFLKPARIGLLIRELKRYFFLVATANIRHEIVPSPLLDMLWRLLLTHSQIYDTFCA